MKIELVLPAILALTASACMTPAPPIAPGAGFAQVTLEFES